MAESVTIARPYAQGVFRLACESGKLDRWSARLDRLVAIASDAQMSEIIGNPKLSSGQVADLFLSLSGESNDSELTGFVHLLADNERFAVLPEIRTLFEEFKSAEEGVREALITSAYPIDAPQLAALTTELEAHFGGRLQPRVEVDAALIGGIRIAVGDEILDASVRGKLDAMAALLKN